MEVIYSRPDQNRRDLKEERGASGDQSTPKHKDKIATTIECLAQSAGAFPGAVREASRMGALVDVRARVSAVRSLVLDFSDPKRWMPRSALYVCGGNPETPRAGILP